MALSLLSTPLFLFAQDPLYSQFYASPILLNPAFTGATNGIRGAMNFRSQWNVYNQYALAGDMPLHFLGSRQGVGISTEIDQQGNGALAKTHALLHYSYEIQINDDNALRLGVSGGIENASFNYARLTFPDQISSSTGAISQATQDAIAAVNPTSTRPDANFGVAYYNRYAFAGVSLMHIIPMNQTFKIPNLQARYYLPMRVNVSGGVRIPLGDFRHPEKLNITPAFLFMQQGKHNQLNVGAYLNISPMTFGLWYRHRDAVIGMIGIEKKPLRIGYSFDYTVGELGMRNTGGSHELSIVFEMEQAKKGRKMKHKQLPCPHY